MDAQDTRFQYVKGILNTSHRVPTIVEPVVSVTSVVAHWQLYRGANHVMIDAVNGVLPIEIELSFGIES